MNHILLQPSVLFAVIGTPLLAAAGWFNWRTERVPNLLLFALLILSIAVAWVVELPAEDVNWRAAVFGGSLVCSMAVYTWVRGCGGGLKLIAVTTLWLPPMLGAVFALASFLLIAHLWNPWRARTPKWAEFVSRQYSTIVALIGIFFLFFVLSRALVFAG